MTPGVLEYQQVHWPQNTLLQWSLVTLQSTLYILWVHASRSQSVEGWSFAKNNIECRFNSCCTTFLWDVFV